MPTFKMKKLRLRGIKEIAQGHISRKWWSQDLNSSSLVPESKILARGALLCVGMHVFVFGAGTLGADSTSR